MSVWKRNSIKSHEIAAMQMFTQAEEGTSSWTDAAEACYQVGFYDEAEYAYRMAGFSNTIIKILINESVQKNKY